jgi:hypothetical protein
MAKPMTRRVPDPADRGIYTAEMGQPPVPYEPVVGKAKGGKVAGYAKGGSVSSASKRADGIAQRGKTKGRFV